MSASGQDAVRRLIDAVVDIESHVAGDGWDQPARLFALADASELAAAEPELAEQLDLDAAADEWVPIEQDWPDGSDGLDDTLAGIGWPDEVHGCVLVVERMVLPPDAEAALIDEGLDPTSNAFAERAAAHPARRDVRMVVAVQRDGVRACRLRVQQGDGVETFTDGPDLVPGLARALAATFEE
jgi:hypothetical protein